VFSAQIRSSFSPPTPIITEHRYNVDLRCRLLATTSADSTAKIWDTSTLKEEKTLVDHQHWVWDAAFSADSAYLLTGASDKTAKLWDLSQGEVARQYTGHQKAISCIALNDVVDSSIATAAMRNVE